MGNSSAILEACLDGDRIGAAYAGPCWGEAQAVLDNGYDHLAKLILRNVRSLRGVGVELQHRGHSVGSGLVRATERTAVDAGSCLIIGVAHGAPPLEHFYTRLGYVLGEPAKPLVLRAGHESGVFPPERT
ncbi:GNAT family N-acetyltransferase [Curtobacterium sp. MCPF17_052]|uniref:GNAT family N-acetyltransferase n=1 Tax=Curtobacterium sp. MCPF17_052 TaxID=2175655 RepID=UPI0034644216